MADLDRLKEALTDRYAIEGKPAVLRRVPLPVFQILLAGVTTDAPGCSEAPFGR